MALAQEMETPKSTGAHASCNGKPVGVGLCPFPTHNPLAAVGEPPVFVVVSAGTLRDASNGAGVGLYDQGLSGDRQKRLIAGEASFSSLLFQTTSFNCGNIAPSTWCSPCLHPRAIRLQRAQHVERAWPSLRRECQYLGLFYHYSPFLHTRLRSET